MPQAKSRMTLGLSQIRDDDPDLYVLQHDAKAAKRGWLVSHVPISPYPFRGAQSKA